MEEEKLRSIFSSGEETTPISSKLDHEDNSGNELPDECDGKRSEPNYNCDSNASDLTDSNIVGDHETKVEENSQPPNDSEVLGDANASDETDALVTNVVPDHASEASVTADAPSSEVYVDSAADKNCPKGEQSVGCSSATEKICNSTGDEFLPLEDTLYSSPTNQMKCSNNETIDSCTTGEVDVSTSQFACDTNAKLGNLSQDESELEALSNGVHRTMDDDTRCESDISVGNVEFDVGSKDDSFLVTELMSNETISDLFDKVYDRNCGSVSTSSKDLPKGLEPDGFESCPANADFKNDNSVLYNLDLRQKSDLLNVATKSSLKRPSDRDEQGSDSPCKKSKKGITFNSVSVYYFPRTQGFTCIPSQGGSTLGMSWNHSHIRTFSLGEHAAEQRRAHRQYCAQQFSSPRNWNEMPNMSSEDSDSDEIISDSEMDFENYNFLQPIPTRERRAMLRAAGIHKIDSEEKDECRSIRLSREFCGCTCQIYCDPERCVCAQAGIKCQVDRMNFPCSCTRDGCANEHGRIEFNPVRVRTHYIHTLMRLEMEKKKEEEEQRNRLILNNLENSSQLSYSSSSSASVNVSSNSLMNFPYHNNLQPYYQHPPTGYGVPVATSVAGSCFNFSYPPNDQFGLPSAETSPFHQAASASMRLTGGVHSVPPAIQYCPDLSPSQEERLSVPEYVDDDSKGPDNQNFIIRDLTNSSKSGDGNEPYSSESFIQLGNDNFEQHLDAASQAGTLDTSTEVSEETEKEESDTENFGDIIKKTMVESVIA